MAAFRQRILIGDRLFRAHCRRWRKPELSFWESIKNSADAEDFQAYLDKYPTGQFVALAERRLKKKPAKVAEPAANAETSAVAGTVIKDCIDCPEMVILPAGSFEMGSSSGDSDEKPIHTVTIAKPFALAKTEVTQSQWRDLMGSDPPELSFKGCDDCPVENVNWNDAREYVRKLSQKTGKTYRLPSEAEWEYACRAGSKHTYCGGDDINRVAWHSGNSDLKTSPVASKQPNAWGLYDMSGNVWEWTEDCYHGNYNGAPGDGSAWNSGCDGDRRAQRGGSWGTPQAPRAAVRNWIAAAVRLNYLGFRPVRMLDPSAPTKPPHSQSAANLPSGSLEWAESDNGADINWNEATHYCASKGSGWGLPTVAELENSYKTGQPTPCHNSTCKVASRSRLTGLWFWSNEPNGSSEVRGVSLLIGERGTANVKYRINARALCVRRP